MISPTALVIALALAQAAPPPSAPPAASPQPPSASPQHPVLTLDQALRQAQAKNLDILQAKARLDQAKQASWKAWSGYLPQVAGNSVFTRNEVQATIPLPTPEGFQEAVVQKRDQLTAQLQVRQALIAPSQWPAIQNAYRFEDLAATNTENGRRQVLFGVAQLYYGAAGVKQAMAVTERQLAISRDHERDARIRYEVGTTPKVALLRAEIDRARAEQDLRRAQNAYSEAKEQLAQVLDRPGADFEVDVPPEQRPPQDPSRLEEIAARDRLDVVAARQGLAISEGTRTGTVLEYLPTLGAFGQLNWANFEGFTGKRTNWAIGLSLNWNIFDGGLREANLREDQARVVEAELAQRSAEAKARTEVRRALLGLESARAHRIKAKEEADLARENQKLVEVNFKAGAATYLEVADAQAALLSAELGYVRESLNADLAVLELENAAGIFNPLP